MTSLSDQLRSKCSNDNYIKKYLPKEYGHDCFTAILPTGDKYRIYKIDYVFSTMGEEYVIRYYISRRDLEKWNRKRHTLVCGNYEDFVYETTSSEKACKQIIGKALKTGMIRINNN